MPSRRATASIAARGTQALPVCRFIWFCAMYSTGITALACLPGGYFATCRAISASLSASNAKCAGCSKSALLLSAMVYLSISPNTTSSDPMIAQMSASMCRFAITSIACRCANPVARILQRYGRLVPSATR